MKLIADKSFKRSFKHFIKKNSQLENKIFDTLDILENDPFGSRAVKLSIKRKVGNALNSFRVILLSFCRALPTLQILK